VLSVLAWTPIALHAHATGNDSQFTPDFCTAIATDNSTSAPLPARPDHETKQTFHCGDCAGCAGGSLSPPAVVTPALVVTPVASVVTAQRLPVVSHDDLVARPRGPPLA
jgi:hypothetical protein